VGGENTAIRSLGEVPKDLERFTSTRERRHQRGGLGNHSGGEKDMHSSGTIQNIERNANVDIISLNLMKKKMPNQKDGRPDSFSEEKRGNDFNQRKKTRGGEFANQREKHLKKNTCYIGVRVETNSSRRAHSTSLSRGG